MKRVLLTVLLLTMVAGGWSECCAQVQGRGRGWRRGPLTVADFGAMPYGARGSSHLEVGITFSASGVTEGIDIYRYCRTSAVMYPAASWIVEDSTTERELNYNQMLFDLVEVHRRQMQREAMLLSNRQQYSRLQELATERLQHDIERMQIATDYGRDSAAVEQLRQRGREWLNAHPGDRPEFTLSSSWWDIGLSYGLAIPTGGLANHYSTAIGTQGMDLAYGWGRHGIFYSFASGSLRTYDTNDYYMEEFTEFRIDVNFGYGFTVLDRPRYSITPYVALGVTEFTWWYGDSYTFGVLGRYHVLHWHRITNGTRNKARRNTASVTGNLFATYTNLDPSTDRKGVTLGLQVGLQFISRAERVTW